MNSEEDEFKRIEAEALRRAAKDEDDTQSYLSENFLEDYRAGAAAEREACAKLVDHILKEGGGTYGDAIRARSQT
jgi:hypothetical protein